MATNVSMNTHFRARAILSRSSSESDEDEDEDEDEDWSVKILQPRDVQQTTILTATMLHSSYDYVSTKGEYKAHREFSESTKKGGNSPPISPSIFSGAYAAIASGISSER